MTRVTARRRQLNDTLHTHLALQVLLPQGQTGLPKNTAISEIGKHWIEKHFHCFFKAPNRTVVITFISLKSKERNRKAKTEVTIVTDCTSVALSAKRCE